MGKTTRTKGGKPRAEPEVVNAQVKDDDPKRPIRLVQDHVMEYPQLFLQVYITEPAVEPLFAEMFARADCLKADDIRNADLVVFTGGADVNPRLYHEEDVHPNTRTDPDRDARDMEIYTQCLLGGIPMLGVCRGAQFLHVMNGGRLWQDVDGHIGQHSMVDVKTKEVIQNVSSTHHQLCIPNNRMTLLATASKSKRREYNSKEIQRGNNADVEAFVYTDTACLGIQGHPEFQGYPRFTIWALKQIETRLIHHSKMEVVGNNYRLKRDVEVS